MSTVRHVGISSIVALIFSGLLLGLPSCSAILGIGTECDKDADCASKGTNLVCKEQLCIDSADTANEENTDTDETDPLTGLDLLGGQCSRVDGLDNSSAAIPKDAIIVGSILPLTGELAIAGESFDQVTLLALEEINRAGGIFGRKIIKISCDSGTSPEVAAESARHLRDLGVQAVLGPFSSEIVVSVYNDVFRDAGMMMVSAGANAPIISTVSADGMIWSTSLPAAREATVMAEHVLRTGTKKVAVIHRGDTWGDSMFNAFYSVYCSERGVDCTDDEAFLVRSYETGDLTTSMSAAVTELAAWQPDVTIAFTYIEDALTFFSIVGMTGAPLSNFLWNSTLASDMVFSLLDPKIFPLLCGAEAVTQQMPGGIVYGSFLTRYRARWGGSDPLPYTAAFYDAMYLLGYAVAAATDNEHPNPTGAEIAAGMRRLSEGTRIAAGAEDWNVGIMALYASSKSTIDYVGASGDLDYSGGTGSMICPVEAVRFNVENQKVESLGLVYSVDDVYTPPVDSNVSDAVCEDLLMQ